jgi:hypothetical protein
MRWQGWGSKMAKDSWEEEKEGEEWLRVLHRQ